MNIFIIIPSLNFGGGIERVVTLQANYWVQHYSYNVFIITNSKVTSSFYQLDPAVRVFNIAPACYSKKSHFSVINKVKNFYNYYKNLKDLCLEYHPNVVLSMMHGYDVFLWPFIKNKFPIIAINHITMTLRSGEYEHGIRRFLAYIKYRLLLFTLRKYDAVVSLSKTDEFVISKINENSIYIPNPILLKHFEKCDIRKKNVVCVGRLDYLKGQDRLIDIWGDISSSFPDWKLIFVGDGILRSSLEEQVRNNNLSNSVVFTGQTDSVFKILSEASIFAFTSRTESFGMVILEAYMNGLPVICYDCESGPRDIVQSNYTGFLIPDGNKRLFVEKLSLLMENENMRILMGHNCLDYVKNFDIKIIMEKYNNLIMNLISK